MSTTNDLSAVALAISVFALIIALGQIVQQYFATAEGFRRCRKDVIGTWSELTKSPFDWRNFRFETRFASPHISLARPRDFYKGSSGDSEGFSKALPIGHDDLPKRTIDAGTLPSARVSWLALLDHLRSYQLGLYHNAFGPVVASNTNGSAAEKGHNRHLDLDEWFDHLHENNDSALTMPVASKIMVSWDFMPPDAMKPFATISLHDLLVLGHRLCLNWTEVNPMGDRLTAQDDYGNDISAHRIRGLGLMVQFQHDSGRSQFGSADVPGRSSIAEFKTQHLFVPSAEADKLAFGIIPGDTRLRLDDVLAATREDCLKFVEKLDENLDNRPRDACDLLRRSFEKSQLTKSGFDQLMPLISPCLVLAGCKTTMVRRPNEWCHVGVLEVMEGFVVFRERIQKMKQDEKPSAGCKDTIEWIQSQWKHLADSFMPFVWAAFRDHGDKARLSAETARVHNDCTDRLEAWIDHFLYKIDNFFSNRPQSYAPPSGRRPMYEMLRFHLWRALALRERAEKMDRATIDTYGLNFPDAPIYSAMMHLMIDDLDDLCKDVIKHVVGRERYSVLNEEAHEIHDELIDEVRTAWLVWMFRAFVFNRSATFVEPRRPDAGGRPYKLIPAQWLYSQIPVHIS